jgi:hypothetical protein
MVIREFGGKNGDTETWQYKWRYGNLAVKMEIRELGSKNGDTGTWQ